MNLLRACWTVFFACGLIGFSRGDDLQYRQAMASAVRAAAEKLLPSVVTVEVIGTAGTVKGEVAQDAPTSGVIVARSGKEVEILVSNIVLRKPAATILVVLPDGSRHAASVVSQDYHRDLALLRIETDTPVNVASLPKRIDAAVGSTVVAIGRYGSDQSPMISTGIFSAGGRLDGIAIQTDARVPPAMYGGPLIDLYGNLLGVLIPAVAAGGAEDATSWYDSGIAFAIPADVIAKKLKRLRVGTDIKKGLIGIVAGGRDPNESDTTIAAVRVRSPAEAAGIKAGDKVVSVNGVPVVRHQQIKQVLGSFDAGESLAVVVRRDDEDVSLTVTLTDTIPPLQPQRLGIVVSEGTGDESETDPEKSKTQIVIQHVLPKSPADSVLQPGDQITKLGEINVANQQLLRRQLMAAEPDQKMLVTWLRDGKAMTETIQVESISGPIADAFPAGWNDEAKTAQDQKPAKQADAKPLANWTIQKIQLPDAANAAAMLAPSQAGADKPTRTSLGMLVVLLEPGQTDPEKSLRDWKSSAIEAGVVVVAIAAEDAARWQAKELQVVSNLAAAAIKKAPIDPSAVAVATHSAIGNRKATAADSMAIAVAISQSETFFGVAIAADTRPPAVRLRENEPSSSLQILMPSAEQEGLTSGSEDLPGWAETLKRSGYPIVVDDQIDDAKLLRWCRLLQAI